MSFVVMNSEDVIKDATRYNRAAAEAAWLRRINLFISSVNLVAKFPPLNSFVQDNIINNNFVKGKLEEGHMNSNHISLGWSAITSLSDVSIIFTDIIINQKNDYINVFIAAWDIYKTTDEYNSLKNNPQQIEVESIVNAINSLKPEE